MKTTLPWRHLLVGGLFGMTATPAVAHPSAGIVVDDQGVVFFADLSRGLWKSDAREKLSQVHQEGNHNARWKSHDRGQSARCSRL